MKWFKRIGYSLVGLFVVAGILVALLQSRWGQETIRSMISSALAKGGVVVEIGSIEGHLPQKLTLKRVAAKFPDGSTLTVDTLGAQISLFHFLKNEISFKEVDASGAVWKTGGTTVSSTPKGPSVPRLPMSLSAKSVAVSDATVDGIDSLTLKGRVEIGSSQHHLFIDVKAARGEDTGRFMLLVKKNGTSQWRAETKIADSSILDPLYKAPVQGAIEGTFYATAESGKEIRGRLEGTVSPKNVPVPFQKPWTFKSRFKHPFGGNWSISKVSFNSDLLQGRGSAMLDSTGQLIDATGQIQSDEIIPKPFEGRLFTRLLLRREGDQLVGKAVAQVPTLKAGPFEWKNVELIANGLERSGSFDVKGEGWKGDGNYSWGESLKLTALKIVSPEVNGTGDLEFFSDGRISGSSDLVVSNIQILKPLAPEFDPYGELHVKSEWNGLDVKLDLIASNLYLKSFYFQKAALYSNLHDPFRKVTGQVSIDVEKGNYHDLNLDSAILETQIGGASWPFRLFAEGVWSRDFRTELVGSWHLDQTGLEGTVQNWNGSFYHQPFSLLAPVYFERNGTKTEISNVDLSLAASNLTGRFKKEKDSGELYLRLEQFPLDFLSINPLEVSITGQLDFEGQLIEKDKRVNGDFKAALKYVEISELGDANPINAEGILTGRLEKDAFLLQGALSARDEPLASIDLKLPVHLDLEPWRIELLYSKPVSGHFALNGRIEDFLDFFNLGPHWLEGDCNCDFKWSNTLRHPLVEGYFRLEDGYYENYYTGTQMTHLEADFLAERDTLHLRSLKARDGAGKGSLLGDGTILLRIDEKLPFRFHLAMQNFNFVQLGFIDAEANGAIELNGNLDSALAEGQIHISDSAISIPDNLTRKLPNLQVVYRNAQKPPEPLMRPASKAYPLNLNLKIDAPKGVKISGRGLQSEWKGDFVLGGTYSSPQPKGTLELILGEFSFSGRAFKLTRGALTFTGQEKEMPHLDLSGATEQQGISIIVNLSGPLTSPQLTFQSVPPLPLSAIIAHLLFGEDISEINGLQALQLAASVAKIAGEGPDVLENTRRSLGIDRLRIVSAPNDEGGESIAIQVGKYVAKGVIVSISQSTENSAPNISIEVDIGAGFFFQAESDQVHEQGKFAFKWNRNY